jgi:hypothetical protein
MGGAQPRDMDAITEPARRGERIRRWAAAHLPALPFPLRSPHTRMLGKWLELRDGERPVRS